MKARWRMTNYMLLLLEEGNWRKKDDPGYVVAWRLQISVIEVRDAPMSDCSNSSHKSLIKEISFSLNCIP